MEPGAPHWTDWTSRSLELLDVELRSPEFRRDRAVALGIPEAPPPPDATAPSTLAAARAALSDASTDEALLTAARAAIDARAPMLALMALSGVDTRETVPSATRADVSALRGAARVQHDERLEAGHAFEQALALDPQHPVALRGQLTLALQDRDFRRALPLAERLHQLHPDDTGILLQLGAARLGETQRAYRDGATADAAAQAAITLETLEQARARMPNAPDVHRNLAILHTATALASAMPTPALEAALSALHTYETTARAASRTVDARELGEWREELERHGRRTLRRAERQKDKDALAMCATLAERAAPRVTTCLTEAKGRAPKASGLVRATWAVLEGDTRDIAVPVNTTGDAALGACVTREVDGWTFGDTTCDMTWEWTLGAPSPGK
jgi:tetratricopeptide (TPR) repeat protein